MTDRFSRLLNTITLLMQQERVTAQFLADRYGVSKRTIYRDVTELEAVGLPVVLFKGRGGGIGIMPGFALDRSILSQREILLLLRLLKSYRKLPVGPEIESVYQKLSMLLREHQKTLLRGASHVVIDSGRLASAEDELQFHLLEQAIVHRKCVAFSYAKKQVWEPRVVEPYHLILKYGWYLVAYCRLRSDFRTFKLSRIHDIVVQDEQFVEKEVPDHMLDFGRVWSGVNWVEVSLQVPEALRKSVDLVEQLSAWEVSMAQTDSGVLYTFSLPENEWLYRYLLGLSALGCQVTGPAHVRQRISDLALGIYQGHRNMTT